MRKQLLQQRLCLCCRFSQPLQECCRQDTVFLACAALGSLSGLLSNTPLAGPACKGKTAGNTADPPPPAHSHLHHPRVSFDRCCFILQAQAAAQAPPLTHRLHAALQLLQNCRENGGQHALLSKPAALLQCLQHNNAVSQPAVMPPWPKASPRLRLPSQRLRTSIVKLVALRQAGATHVQQDGML